MRSDAIRRGPGAHARLVAAMLLGVVACAPAARVPPVRPSGPPAPQPKVDAAALEKHIHGLINAERRRAGLPQLAWDPALAGIARKHSRDMLQRGYFGHESPQGQGFSDRYRRQGYVCAVTVHQVRRSGAENIALNHLYGSVRTINGVRYYDWKTEAQIAAAVVTQWMKSSGHRRNILTPHWRREGLGVAVEPKGRVYVTQNFC